jgi:NTE family protein
MIPDPERGGRQVLVDLALQGGGAHGAFTWGVLDRLLDASGSASKAYLAPRPGQ